MMTGSCDTSHTSLVCLYQQSNINPPLETRPSLPPSLSLSLSLSFSHTHTHTHTQRERERERERERDRQREREREREPSAYISMLRQRRMTKSHILHNTAYITISLYIKLVTVYPPTPPPCYPHLLIVPSPSS